ncbi:MAG TPA: AAA family ATPase [Candidatus Acidoferrales bacterium]|nr:AAA family ATPase [Candidatus Acidoferrales bacterium]
MFLENSETLDEDLSLARNAKGEPLKEATKADIRALIDQPDTARWEKCSTVILRGGEDVETLTLWKAVCEVEPAFPVTASHDEAGNRIWEQIPAGRTIRRAIRWAVSGEEVPVTIAEAPPATPSSANGTAEADPWTEIDIDPTRKSELQKWFSMFQAQHPAAPRGLLLFGPPGTGKTLLARTLAKAAGAQFIATTISDLKAPHVGGTGERIRQLWRRARQNARAIIFVDDCEGIFGSREDVDNDAFNREALQEFLAQWEGVLDNSRHVWVIGATNKRERIDHAMVSRFGAEFEFSLPNATMRGNILRRELKRCWVDYDAIDEIVAQTNGFSGRDLRTLAESVARESFSEVTKACVPTKEIFERYIAAIRKRGNIGVTKRSTWDNLILSDEIKSELQITCEMLRRSEEMKSHNIDLPRGLLLHGPSGTGKTEIARTLANESGLNFIGTKSTDFVGGYSGWSGQMTKAIFARARAESPAILFIDEVDKIAPKPEGIGGTHGFTVEVIRSLVEEMEGVGEQEGHVFVIGATSRIEAVDPEVRSRLGKEIGIPLPDLPQREALLLSRLRGVPVDFDLEAGLREISEATPGWSGRDLVTLVAGAQRRAVMRFLRGTSTGVVLALADFRENLATSQTRRKPRRWWPFSRNNS